MTVTTVDEDEAWRRGVTLIGNGALYFIRVHGMPLFKLATAPSQHCMPQESSKGNTGRAFTLVESKRERRST